MKHLFLFECKKIIKKKTIGVSFFLTFAAIVVFYFFSYAVAENIHQGNITNLQNNIIVYQGFIDDLELERKEAEKKGDFEAAEEKAVQMEQLKKGIKKAEIKKGNYLHEEWNKIYQSEIPELKNWVEHYDTVGYAIEEQLISSFTARATLEEISLIVKNDVEPFIQNTKYNHFLPTIYDHFTGSALEQWEEITKRYSTTGLSFLYQMIQNHYIPIIVLIGCFIFGNNVSSEANKKRRGLHFYFVQPIHRKTLLLAKYLSGLVYTLGFVLFMFIVPLLCSLFTKGLGSLNYPVLVYEGSEPNPFGSEFNALDPIRDKFHFIDMIDYLLQASAFAIVIVIFLYSLYYAVSLFIKSPLITIILMSTLIYGGMRVFPSAYNPFTYIDIHKILTGETAALAFNPAINFQNGILLFFILLVIIGCFMIFLRFSNVFKIKKFKHF